MKESKGRRKWKKENGKWKMEKGKKGRFPVGAVLTGDDEGDDDDEDDDNGKRTHRLS